ncbi:class I SAM-dependent methyltransferase [Streptosporangium roseum]|uniref:Cyclopropane-fatty-acyl-phospholipid synthase n=1 Tax=Streptosporangium roseum (strain ATCC 12428 / DSM 43021 / JCM 3005 / KCTC 9067 / NCIMB 10171 / NRRL 2505 / NI 9100) TaxID=479432 RepID=D2B886_STRRD|nr:class I SAM-dependent methyltransferase [Streptosporangium roseum]ACZ85876.1 Cyclopropane-fatty-acyl-phospholipid synthase [Streptosporangium roseum DSM 43021]
MTLTTDRPAAFWPDVDTLPPSRLRGALARRLFLHAVRRLPLTVELPGGRRLGAGGPVMRLRRPEAFYRRVGAGGLIGFGEAYMARDWEADDLPAVLTVMAERLATLIPPGLQRLRRLAVRRVPRDELGGQEDARRNIHRHYDLSNDLFAEFLDETLTYSAALFDGPASWETLAGAQRAKIDRLLDQAGVGPGSRLLEIGTGWGELALRAARRGAAVVSITLSQEQWELARARVADAGLSDRVEILLADYREVSGGYDAIVSVEMVEAVGARYWPVYFAALERLLAPGGRIAIQAITMPHERMLATLDTHTWVRKYIFPGGMLPSVTAIEDNLGGLRITDRLSLRADYAETLRLWRERYLERVDAVGALGFDETFHRMWILYLAYSEAGFRSRYLDVWQLTLGRRS